MTDRELLEALAVEDPICHSQEGLDDACHFCGAEDKYCWPRRDRERPCIIGEDHWETFSSYADHYTDCPWIAAMNRLERPLGHHSCTQDPEGRF